MRRGTLITIIALLLLVAVAAIAQLNLGSGERRHPGPRVTETP